MKLRYLSLAIFLLLAPSALVFAEEKITITTYYPSPYGSYNQLQTNSLGVGDNDNDGSLDSGDAPNPATNPGDVWIAGNVGIGTTEPVGKLDVKGKIRGSGTATDDVPIYYQSGAWTFANAQTQCVSGYRPCTWQEFIAYSGLYYPIYASTSAYGWSSVRALAPCNTDGNCEAVGVCSSGKAILLTDRIYTPAGTYGLRGTGFCYTDSVTFGVFCCQD